MHHLSHPFSVSCNDQVHCQARSYSGALQNGLPSVLQENQPRLKNTAAYSKTVLKTNTR